MIKMVSTVTDPMDERDIHAEITYLLHIRRIGKEYVREANSSMDRQLKDLMNNFSAFQFNQKVMVVLIETGYIQQVLNVMSKSDYPKFLITLLKETDRGTIKEACCRMIIKFFGRKKAKDEGGKDEGQGKIEFINLVEPLVAIVSRSKENGDKLTALSVMAIVNMCNFSEDIKDIFLQKNGFSIIVDLMNSKDEDILLNTLRLVMTLIAQKQGDTSMIGRTLAEENDN